ncbi:tail fiber protein [Pedobacter gandavensis]|uniref:phage tail protein n=1 Tax=Pedobacter TaxID=84567 RepID=UPI001C994E3A|nr:MULTISPECIES: tail fiber protein [Pedobacter]WGQ11285.1 tail fiber protein [Pedobacter gandavensis]
MPSEPILGEVSLVAFNFAPRGWATCNGQLVSLNQNTALFAILGTTYGGDGTRTFGLPNFQDKIPVHFDTAASDNYDYSLGASGGMQTVNLTINHLPAHNHTVMNNGQVQAKTGTNANLTSPVNGYFASNTAENQRFTASPDIVMGTINPISTNNSGGNQAHENMQPFQTVNFIIALEGIFPTRN